MVHAQSDAGEKFLMNCEKCFSEDTKQLGENESFGVKTTHLICNRCGHEFQVQEFVTELKIKNNQMAVRLYG